MLNGKNAVVTGSTSGIGLGIAEAFAAAGANVMLNGLGDADAIEEIRAGLEAKYAVKVAYSPANMLKPDEIAAMVKGCESTFGSADIRGQ